MRFLRFRLIHVFVCVAVVAAACAAFVPSARVVVRERKCDGFNVRGVWVTQFGMLRSMRIVAYPKTRAYTVVSPFIDSDTSGPGVVISGRGIFVNGEKRTSAEGDQFWVYVPKGRYGDVEPIKNTHGPKAAISVTEFEKLEQLPVWREVVFPVLVETTSKYKNDLFGTGMQ